MSAPIVLLQIGSNPFNTVFEDAHGEAAFTIQEVERTPTTPNTLVRLRREQLWSALYHTISGPGATYFYFGPESAPGSGYIVYGNSEAQSMTSVVRKKRGSASMRYFTTHMGKELRWKLSDSSGHMECSDGSKLLAVYEAKHPDLPRPRATRSRSNTQSSFHQPPTTPISPLTSPITPNYTFEFGAAVVPPYDNARAAPYPFANGHAHGAGEHAVLTIQPAALPVVTEVVTTLMLIRMGGSLRW